MATYSTSPGKFQGGSAYSREKAREEADRAKRLSRVHVLRDEWRRDHPRRLKDSQPLADRERDGR